MNNFIYFPIIKTRDAELKAMHHLDASIEQYILPIYELTKSRKTNKTPDGDIHRKMKELNSIQKDRPFILDVCTNDKYTNEQTLNLLSSENGFFEWQYFLNTYSHLNIIPMIHIIDDNDFSDVIKFIKSPFVQEKDLAIRFPIDIEKIDNYLREITPFISDKRTLYTIIDAGQINEINYDTTLSAINIRLEEIHNMNCNTIQPIVAGTSFPKIVSIYGDKDGEFPILEEKIFQAINNKHVKYGDYASINLEQIEIKGGTFVPRIDISLKETFIYKRYRRKDGSYPLCAKKMITDPRYLSLNTWADMEILQAKNNTPSGISPSFWISVRMNYFMTHRVKIRLSK